MTFALQPTSPPAIELPTPTGKLSVKGVIKYPPAETGRPNSKPILANVSFELHPGDALGVIGPSACGKSTLARLLVGAWPVDAGEIRLDDALLDQWAPEQLGKYIGYLPQRVELLAGTIRDNIARFRAEAKDEDVIAAAKIAGVHEMILKLPAGYSAEIGQGKLPLSGGQIQRIGLARALFAKPKLIVLDEPNSNLDAQGDAALTQAILAMRKAGSVVVVMAHRPSAISAVSQVMVLQEGMVTDYGDRDSILRKMTQPATNPPSRQGIRRTAENG